MRETCQVALPSGLCGKPAVDYIDEVDDRFYLCAEHYDEFADEEYPDDDLSEEDFDDFD
jgi:hypothetical protein